LIFLAGLVKESTNSPDFIRRTGIAALVSGVVVGLCVAWVWGWPAASGFVLALLWSLGNVAVLAAIMRTAINPSGIDKKKLIGLMLLKLIGFYGAAVWILVHRWFPVGAFAAGMGWPLLVGALRAWTPRLPAPSRHRGATR
jgi:hypothetical protein